jgi:primosomal protein N' (replication factor Y) (superfamily II helicase)
VAKLFEDPDQPAEVTLGEGDCVVAVAVNANVWRTYDYLWPAAMGAPAVGMRVSVSFGRGGRKTVGVITATDHRPGTHKLKPVGSVIDEQPQLDESLMALGAWISHYYLAPLGMTLAAMVPSAVGQHAEQRETVVYLASEPKDWPKRLGGRQKRVLDELIEARRQDVEPLALEELMHHSGASRDSIKRLSGRELIRLDTRPVTLPELVDAAGSDPFDLNEDQQSVLAALKGKLGGGFSTTLLHGVTGSGKTEVYVRAIRDVVAAGKQAILLVPEIALATQTLQRLLDRLPRVAVLHSGLTGVQRAFYYGQIRDGGAAVVVGPRSAIFAPTRKLGLIIVDEEHESSYKQDTAPRYHGRDVAVKRASLADVPIILGSATPSLESLHNVQQGRYELARLPRRVRGLPMPSLEIVHLRNEMQAAGRVELIGKTLTRRMATALDRGEQIILLMNRRGYASFVFCPKCKWEMKCDHCERAMVFHQATQLVMCHYCQHTLALPEQCPACAGKLLLFGMGIQRVAGELARKFPEARLARMDSDTMTSAKQFQKVFDAFSGGELDILLGTQMVAKGLDFPRVSLVGVISADTSLAVPDFRADERTFQLIVQVAGRAGRSEHAGQVVVQTLHADRPAVALAAEHDYDGFAKIELAGRKDGNFPPFSRLVRFIVRDASRDKAEAAANDLAGRLRGLLSGVVTAAFGPQPAAIPRIRNQFRWELLFVTDKGGAVQQIISPRMEQLAREVGCEIIADVDPVTLI